MLSQCEALMKRHPSQEVGLIVVVLARPIEAGHLRGTILPEPCGGPWFLGYRAVLTGT